VLTLAIRSLSLSAAALGAVWYAIFGGRDALAAALPEISRFAPPVAWIEPEDPLGWPGMLLMAAVAALIAVKRTRALRRRSTRRPIPSPADQALWAAHLAWLDDRLAARVAVRESPRASAGVPAAHGAG